MRAQRHIFDGWKYARTAVFATALVALSAPSAQALPALQLYGSDAAVRPHLESRLVDFGSSATWGEATLESFTGGAGIARELLAFNPGSVSPHAQTFTANNRVDRSGERIRDTGSRGRLRIRAGQSRQDVPEASTLSLFGLGLVGLILVSRRRARQK